MRACKIAVALLVGFLVHGEAPARQFREADVPELKMQARASAARRGHEEFVACRWKFRRRSLPRCQPAPILEPRPLKEGGVDLRWKLKVHEPFYQEISTTISQKMTVMNMAVNQDQKQTYYLRWTPEKLDDRGQWTLGMKILDVKMSINIGGNRITYPSNEPNPLADFFKEFKGTEFKMTLAPDMTAGSISGAELLIARLAKANPQMEPLLKSLLNDASLMQLPNALFEFVPGKPVHPGDSWVRKREANLGPVGRYVSVNKYTYAGEEAGLDQIKVESSVAYVPSEETGKLPFTIVGNDLKSVPKTGLIVFDRVRGRVVSGVFRTRLEGSLKIDIGGMNTTVELTQAQKVQAKVTDKDPLAKK